MVESLVLAHSVDVSKEVDGIEMGVLKDGTAYLTGRGLARLCGVAVSTIIHQREEWAKGNRSNKLAKLLVAQGFTEDELCYPIKSNEHAYPEAVCMTVLEYFAFESGSSSPVAAQNYRTLARAGLRIFVYNALGYALPPSKPPIEWQKFHDRLLLVSSPAGYFSVFKEAAEFVLTAIRGGMTVDEHTIPDISLGIAWAKYWTEKSLADQYGARIKHEHNYPDYFPQAASNPQDIWVYPVMSLGEFRVWLQQEYVPQRFPKYLGSKVRSGVLPASTAELLIVAATAPAPANLPAAKG